MALPIRWPGTRLSAYLSPGGGDEDPGPWIGSLARGMADQSGLLYRRNRYYDPATGQFTQADPIGLAGGLNLYGYAGGDPVNFSDPFGLSAECKRFRDCLREFAAYQWRGFQAGADPTRISIDFEKEGQFGALAGRALLAAGGAGRVTGAGGRSGAAASSLYDDVTVAGARMANRRTNVRIADFEANLLNAGFRQSTSRDGLVNIFTKDGVRYTTRSFSESTGGPTAEFFAEGARRASLKIRLQP